MLLNSFCSKCGNKLQSWSPYCLVCAKIAKDTRKFGTPKNLVGYNPVLSSSKNPLSQPKVQVTTVETVATSLTKQQEKPSANVILERFNNLLLDAFRQPVVISQFLLEGGILIAEVNKIKQNPSLMLEYLSLLEKSLTKQVVSNQPQIHSDFIRMLYGLDGAAPCSIKSIASVLGCSESSVEYMQKDAQIFLRSAVGNNAIREALLESARILLKTGKL